MFLIPHGEMFLIPHGGTRGVGGAGVRQGMLGRFGGAAPPPEIFAKLNKVRTLHVA